MTRKHFILFADMLAALPEKQREIFTPKVISICSQSNQRFDVDRFWEHIHNKVNEMAEGV